MNPNRLAGFVSIALLAGAELAQAQRPSSFRCRHVLAEDGASFLEDRVVFVLGTKLIDIKPGTEVAQVDQDFGETWMVPGLIDLHTHLCLRPYAEASWNSQVLEESPELRTIRATRHALDTLHAGFVAVRELGTEGAGLADVALRQAFAERIALGPRIFASTYAIVATGCYGPSLAGAEVRKGAQVADGVDGVRRAVREQVAVGADWIKVYSDYRRVPGAASTPTFSQAELDALCDEARSAKVPVAAHASTDEGARRAVLAGVRTIEHGTDMTDDTLRLMAERGVVLCPTLAALEALANNAGASNRLAQQRVAAGKDCVRRALALGVTVACGSDAGVFRHGDNARELELLVECGMSPARALAAATIVAARVLGQEAELGSIRVGMHSGLVVLGKDPHADVRNLRDVRAVVLDESGPIR